MIARTLLGLTILAAALTATAQTATPQCPNAGQTWVRTSYWGGACIAKENLPMALEHIQQQAQEDTVNRQLQQQAEYQQQLLAQQAQYQQQLLRQQADIARRQMALQLMQGMRNQPYVLPMPQAPVVPNNQIRCTTQYIGGIAYTNCY